MTKGKVIQIGFLISFLGILSYVLFLKLGFDNLYSNTISSFILILIVMIWVSSYIYRVVNGKMTFMEQRKRYRSKYEKVVSDKLEAKFNSMSNEDQEKLLKELEKNS